MRARCNQQPSTHPFKFTHVSYEKIVQENSRPRRVHRNLQCSHRCGQGPRRGLLHGHMDYLLLSGLDTNMLREVLVSVLPHADYVLAGEKKNLLRSLEFGQVSDVSSVDPHPGSLFNMGFSFELDLSHHSISPYIEAERSQGATIRHSH